MSDGEREPEPSARPPCESADDDARTTWVWLTWGAGSGHFHVGARLVSLHPEGPSVTCSVPPPPGRQAAIVLKVSDQPEQTAAATVAAVRALGRGVYLVRLKFEEPCDLAFWKAASAFLSKRSSEARPHRSSASCGPRPCG
jgi:hypothetical protein